MKLVKIICSGLCLVLCIGLIFLNVGICQTAKPDEAGTKVPAVSPAGKAPAPEAACPTPAKAPETGKPEGKPAVPAKPPEKEPGKVRSEEGC
jgi:hypothetical protein